MSVAVTTFYKFLELDSAALSAARDALERFAVAEGLRGLVVMSGEGINSTVSGTAEVIARFKELVAELFGEVTYKDSIAPKAPFARFRVDVRPEIITTKDPSIDASLSAGTHLSPREWHEMMSRDPDVVVVDTRNLYETEIGVFKGAVDPKIEKFSEFARFAESGSLPKDKKLLMYCTGGVRCEKAVPEMRRLGYENVFQLEGGILKYLEEFPNGFFEGECFVFDHRVAVDHELKPSARYRLCPHCGNPGETSISCSNCSREAVVCARCAEKSDRRTCSKNCAYHARRVLARARPAAAS